MIQILYLIATLALIVLVSRHRDWGILAAAVALPLSQSLPDTGIPGLNVMNIVILSLGVGMLAGKSDQQGTQHASFAAALPLIFFGLTAFLGWVNSSFIQEMPRTVTRPFSPYGAFLELKEIWTLGLLMFLTFSAARTAEELRRYAALVVAGMSVEVLFCVMEWLRRMGRITGHLRQPNSLGAFMAVVGAITAALFMATPTKRRWAYLLVSAGATFSCIMSRSRGGLLALFASLLILSLFRNRKVFLLLVVLGLCYRLWLPEAVLQRVDQAYEVDETGNVEAADTAATRLAIWQAAFRMIDDHPMGVGLTAFPLFISQYGTANSMNWPNKSAHNDFVSITAELGVQGLFAFLILLATLAGAAYRCYRRGEAGSVKPVGYAGIGALLGMCLATLTGTFFFQAAVSGYFWMMLGLACKGDALSRERASTSRSPFPAATSKPDLDSPGKTPAAR